MSSGGDRVDSPRRSGDVGLRLATREQANGYRYLMHRMGVAVSHWSVRLIHDPSRSRAASWKVGAVIAILCIIGSFFMGWLKPQGKIGEGDKILAARESGALYVKVDGVVHPVLNLASARLIAGNANDPKFVPGKEIRNLPQGAQVGIVGAPADMTVRRPLTAGWSICDRLGSTGAKIVPKTTVLIGQGELGDWSSEVRAPDAVLMSYGGAVFVVTDGHRSQIDLADRAVTLALGLGGGDLKPAPMSRALYEALSPTAPLRVPDVETPGVPVAYAPAGLSLVSGSVIRTKDPAGRVQFFVALPAGLQTIPATLATALGNAGLSGTKVIDADPAQVARLPLTKAFDTSVFPEDRLRLADKAAQAVTCVMWRKDAADPRARVTTVSGRRLPIPIGDELRVQPLVKDGPMVADEVYIAVDSANFVQVTGLEPDSRRNESLWWITDSGVRWGVWTSTGGASTNPDGQPKDDNSNDERNTRKALGLEGQATPAPWSVVKWLPASAVPLSKAAALVARDTYNNGKGTTLAPGPLGKAGQ
ncbi:type VII secretion protein EccB [Mycobacteroides abscessus subsp. massiliense]|nr:type VII secretion protein EccB [Mycobacteroides abscessus subsp. massiliense]